jgi:hypothetical protein
MSQFVELKKTNRKFETIDSFDNILELLKQNIANLILHVKYDIEKTVVKISNILNEKSIDIVTDPNFQPEKNILTVYGLLDKYFEIDFEIVETKGPGFFRCAIKKFKRAADVRKELRLKVKPEQVIASNFIVSKHAIDFSNFKIPTTIKVLLDQFHSENSHLSDIFKVDVFSQNDIILENIKKTKKILFIEDLNNPDTHKTSGEEIINIHELLGDQLSGYIRKYTEKGYKSIIIAPVIYVTDEGAEVPFAYVQSISKSKILTFEDVDSLKKMLTKLVNRIKDANTVVVQINQQIVNLSKSGAKLFITDENLKKYLPTTRGFLFNIVFKLQAPVTIYCEIKNIFRNEEGNVFVGVAFAGHSSRKDEIKRYNSFLDPMIKSYKDQLLQDRKKMSKQEMQSLDR